METSRKTSLQAIRDAQTNLGNHLAFRLSTRRGDLCDLSVPTAARCRALDWWMGADLWKQEVAEITGAYSGATWWHARTNGWNTRKWRLTIDPIPLENELHAVLYDLDTGVDVAIGQEGRVDHSEMGCGIALGSHPIILSHVRIPRQPYLVELTYPATAHSMAGPVHPKARVLVPEISAHTRPRHPHLHVSEDLDSWACPLSPHATHWDWDKGATLRYLDQVAIWILKTAIWTATGGGVLRESRWLGPYAPHDPQEVLNTVSLEAPCRCGGGRAYRHCHLMLDVRLAIMQKRMPDS